MRGEGCDVVHTMDLPEGNRTSDAAIIAWADREGRVVVTKDADFVESHTLYRRPAKLLLISTGNISNAELEKLLVPLISSIVQELQLNTFIEFGRKGIIVRE